MDFREMVYVVTVADLKSITAAARKLYISQPSLSYIISKVEKDVGVKLFERKNYPLTLTYAGEKFVDTARKILMMNDNLRRELMDISSGQKGMISFGMPTERAGYMLPKVVGEYRKTYPKVELRVMEEKSDELIQALVRDEISFMILPRDGSELPSGLRTELIYQEELFFVTSKDLITDEMRAGEDGNEACPQAMAQLPFILLKRGHALRKKTDELMKQHEISPHIAMEVSSCLSAVQLAAVGLGVAIAPRRAVEVLSNGLSQACCLRVPKPGSWNVNAVYKEELYLDQAERHMIDLMKQVFGRGQDRAAADGESHNSN